MAGITLALLPICYKYTRMVMRSGKDRIPAICAYGLYWAFLLLDLLAICGVC